MDFRLRFRAYREVWGLFRTSGFIVQGLGFYGEAVNPKVCGFRMLGTEDLVDIIIKSLHYS